MLYKMTGLDEIIKRVFKNLGELELVYLTGDLAQGRDAVIVDLVLVGDINQDYLQQLVGKTESYISRKIRYVVFTSGEFKTQKSKVLKKNDLLLWKK